MKNWRGMAVDFTALSDGAAFIRNSSMTIDGEFRRRMALQSALSDSSEYGLLMYGPPDGGQFVIIADADGNVDSAEAE